MKRITIVLATAFLFGTIGCEKQEAEPVEDSRNHKKGMSIIQAVPIDDGCDEDYVFPSGITTPNHTLISVSYESYLSQEEIHCIRFSFFSKYSFLEIASDRPSGPYREYWIKPNGIDGEMLEQDDQENDDIELSF